MSSLYKISKKEIRKKLYTEPKDNPGEALIIHNCFRKQTEETKKLLEHKSRAKHVCLLKMWQLTDRHDTRECWRCSAGNFTLNHLKRCKEPDAMCNYCSRKCHLERVCSQKKNTRYRHKPAIWQIQRKWQLSAISRSR